MKKVIEEFKKFALRGNVIDLAVGVVIGAAFTAIVTSLVNDIISPLIGLLVKVDFSELALVIGDVSIKYGAFIMALINFFIVAVVLFSVVKAINGLSALGRKKADDTPPQTKKCPYCLSEIPRQATRCPHCTSELKN